MSGGHYLMKSYVLLLFRRDGLDPHVLSSQNIVRQVREGSTNRCDG